MKNNMRQNIVPGYYCNEFYIFHEGDHGGKMLNCFNRQLVLAGFVDDKRSFNPSALVTLKHHVIQGIAYTKFIISIIATWDIHSGQKDASAQGNQVSIFK